MWRYRLSLWAVVLSAVVLACSGSDEDREDPGTTARVTQALSTCSVEEVLGFECLYARSWGAAASSLSENATEGGSSMQIAGATGGSAFTSTTISNHPGFTVGRATLDVMLENKNPAATWGLVQLTMVLRYRNASGQVVEYRPASPILNHSPLGLPNGAYRRLVLNLSTEARTRLSQPFESLVLTLQVQAAAGEILRFDRLSFTGGGTPLEGPAARSFELITPEGIAWNDVGVGAMGELRIDDRVKVMPAAHGNHVTNAGYTWARLGVDSLTPQVWSVSDVNMAPRASARTLTSSGHFVPDEQQNGTYVIDGVKAGAPNLVPDLYPFRVERWEVQFPSEFMSRDPVFGGQQYQAEPGVSHSSLRVQPGGRLVLSSGVYYFDELVLESGSFVRANNGAGPVIVYVGDSFTHRAVSEYQNVDLANVMFIYLGSTEVMLGEGFRHHVLAPNAKLSIAAGKVVYGGLFGRDIEIQPDVTVNHRGFNPGTDACDAWSIACISMPGCVLPDTDSDGLPDCQESEDDSGWTDPEAPNGAETTLIDTCSAASSCESLADHDIIEACAAGSSGVTAITQGGWNFRDVGGTVAHPQGFSPCDPEYGFTPGWDELLGTFPQICDERLWLAWFKATLEITQSGTHCFELVGVPGGGCGSFFLDYEETGLLSGAGPRCYDIPAGLHPVDWTHESGTGTDRGIEVLHCFGGDQECTPDVPLGPETIRPPVDPGTVDPCDPEHPSCSDLCPCAGCEPCNADTDCPAGQLCDAEAAAACGSTGMACWYPSCREDPIEAGCGSETSMCGPVCPVHYCADEGTSCPAGLVPGKSLAPYNYCESVCVDPTCLTHDGHAANCGGWGKLCGPCTCIPDCSLATCADPDDRCGGSCAGVCASGQSGCTSDVQCEQGLTCLSGVCRPQECDDPGIREPLCGSAGAPCGETCPSCTPECAGRVCGLDRACGESCGSCAAGEFCDSNGQCSSPSSTEPPTVPDGAGGSVPLAPLAEPVTSDVGALPGSFAVTDDGVATYTIPIQVPPGRAGMEPALSLQYGGKVDGIMGVGWRLEGLSVITRCPRIQALDGYTRAVQGDAQDRFCIDGKILEVVGQGSSGGLPVTEYRTLIDSFAKIEAYFGSSSGEGPVSFTVWTKDGRIHTYGTADSSRLAVGLTRTAWLLDRIEDRSGNNIKYEYNKKSSTHLDYGRLRGKNRLALKRVVYTGSPTSGGSREVRFDYEPRPDPALHYASFALGTAFDQRLRRITTAVDGDPVKTYVLKYRDTGDSLVEAVSECARDDETACKSPTTFTYGESPSPPDFEESSRHGYTPMPSALLDANGDGVMDVLHIDPKVKVKKHPLTATKLLYEIGAYAVSSVIGYYTNPAVGMGAGTALSTAEAFIFPDDVTVTFKRDIGLSTPDSTTATHVMVDEPTGVEDTGENPAALVDWDQDGLDDIVVIRAFPLSMVTKYWLELHRSFGDGNFGGAQTLLMYDTSSRNPPVIYDVDGDGLSDIVRCSDSSQVEVLRRSSPQTLLSQVTPWVVDGDVISWSYCSAERRYSVFDIDGDGVLNLVAEHGGGDWASLQMQGPAQVRWIGDVVEEGKRISPYSDARTGDFNGDGLADAFTTTDRLYTLCFNHGGWLRVRQWPRPDFGQTLRAFALMDHDGDGRTDVLENWTGDEGEYVNRLGSLPFTTGPTEFVFREPSGLNAWDYSLDVDGDDQLDVFREFGGQPRLGRGGSSYRLARVVDGMKNVVDINYDAPGTYTTDSKCHRDWPEDCFKRINGLVSSYMVGHESEAASQKVEVRYKYQNAHVNLAGHGWLGFQQRTEIVEAGSERISETTVDYDPPETYPRSHSGDISYSYPKAGLVRRITKRQALGPSEHASEHATRVTSMVNTWVTGVVPGGNPFPRLDSRRTRVVDEIGTTQAVLSDVSESFEADPYGNVTWHYKALLNGTSGVLETVETTSEYTNDPDAWLISNPDSVTTRMTKTGDARSMLRSYSFEYDSNGLLRSTTRSVSGAAEYQHTTHDRDAFGNVTTFTSSEGTGELARSTSIVYDSEGLYPLIVTNPLGQVTQVRFDKRWGAMSAVVDPNGVAQQTSYDAFGRVVETRGPNGTSITTLSAATQGSFNDGAVRGYPVVAVTTDITGASGESGGGSTVELDHLGRPVRRTTAGFGGVAVVETMDYDPAGRLAMRNLPRTSSDVKGWECHYYDTLGRRTATERSDPDADPGMGTGTWSRVEYISRPRLDAAYSHWLNGLSDVEAVEVVVTEDPHSETHVTIHDAHGRVIRSIDGASLYAGDPVSNYGYDAGGMLETISSVDGTSRNYTYDSYGRLVSTNDPNSGWRVYSYNGFDELKTTRTVEGTTTMSYDELGRVTSAAAPDGTSSWQYDVGVNAVGKLVRAISPPSARSPLGVITEYEYESVVANNRGSLRATTVSLEDKELRTEVTCDGLGRPRTVQYPGLGAGTPVIAQYSYDPTSGALARVDETGGPGPRLVWEMEEAYEGMAVGRERFGNGAETSYTYDEHTRQVTSIGTVLSGAVVQALEYTYYANGRVHTRSDSEFGHDEYLYDELGRLAVRLKWDGNGGPMRTLGNAYHPNGNLATYQGTGTGETVYDQWRPQQVVHSGARLYHEYDELGRVTRRHGSDVYGGTQTIEYRTFDLPSRITTGTGASAVVTEYEYSAGGQRVSEHNGSHAHYLLGDAYEAITSDTTGELEEEHFRIFAGGRHVAEITRDSSGVDSVEFIHGDILGSTDAISSESGEFVRQGWEAFGAWDIERSDPPMSGLQSRLGFTGHMDDHGTGLINMKGRLFDPLVGRFMTPDPVVQAPFWSQGHNQYSYVFNDPVSLVDPSGFSGEWAYSEAAVGVGIWSAALMGGTAIGSLGSQGLGALVGLGSASGGSAAGRGLGNTLAGMLGAGPDGVSVAMPSSVAKGSGKAPSGGAKGQNRGGVGGAVPPDVPRLCDVGACLAENNEGGASGMGGHEGASGTGEPQRMGEMPEEALDAGMAAIPGAKGVSLVRRLLSALRLERLLEQVAQSNAEGKAARGVEGLAERAAAAGARYPKQVAQALRMTPDKLQKSITSFTENIAKHQGYLKNPQAHVPNWSQLTQQHQQNLIHHWHSDIGRAEAYRDIAEGVLKGLFR